MKIIKITKLIAGIFLVIALYLAIVGVWASLAVGDLLPEVAAEIDSPLLTENQRNILLKIEDPTFYSHAGIDLSSGQGLTTITSALARDIFLLGKKLDGVKGGFQSFYAAVFDCCKKIDFGRDVMAVVLNKHISKENQLHLYVSNTYMGQTNGKAVIGLPAAANAYFDKPLSELPEAEFIQLVAMLKAPSYYHPVNGATQLQDRALKISRILSGECVPDGWFDTTYEHCGAI